MSNYLGIDTGDLLGGTNQKYSEVCPKILFKSPLVLYILLRAFKSMISSYLYTLAALPNTFHMSRLSFN